MPYNLIVFARFLPNVSIGLGLWTTVGMILLTYVTYNGAPFWDQWEEVTVQDHLAALFGAHNEHRIVVPRLFFIADKAFFAGTDVFNLASIYVFQLCTATLLIWAAWRSGLEDRTARIWAAGAVLGLLFWGFQYENFVSGFHLAFIATYTFAMAAFLVLALGSRNSTVVAAILLAAAATFCMANGILAPIVLVLLTAALRRSWIQVTVLAIAAGTVLVAFSWGYYLPTGSAVFWQALANPSDVIIFTLTYLGAPFGDRIGHLSAELGLREDEMRIYAAVSVGFVGILLLARHAIQIAVQPRVFRPAQYALLAMMTFVAGGALITALGRIMFTTGAAFAPRYGTPSLIFWASALLLEWTLLAQTIRRPLAIFVTVLLLDIAISQSRWMSLSSRFFEPRKAAITALLANAPDEEALKTIYPDPRRPFYQAERIREQHLSIFSQAWAGWRGTRLDGQIQLVGKDRCLGWLDAISRAPRVVAGAQNSAWRASGWAWDKSRGVSPNHVVLVDELNRVVGYAIRRGARPDVAASVSVVKNELVAWQGHIALHDESVREIRAFALVDNDRQACALEGSRTIPTAD